MSFEEFKACIDGWNEANGGGKPSLSDEDFDEIAALYDSAPEIMRDGD